MKHSLQMKRLVYRLLFLVTVFLILEPVIAQQSMTLQQAIDFALVNAPSYQNFAIDRKIADSKKFESITKYLPKINGTAEYKDNLNLAVSQIPAEVFGGTPGEFREVKFGVKYNSTAGLDLSQPIVDAAAIGDILYAKRNTQLSDFQLQQATIDIKVNVTKAYYNAQLNYQKLEKAANAVVRNKRVLEDTKVKFDNQSATKTDVNRTILNWKQSQYQEQLAIDAFNQAKLSLLQYIGADITQPIDIKDKLPLSFKTDTIVQMAEAQTIFANRIEYQVEMQQMTLNQWQLKKTYLQYAPNISLFGYFGGQGFSSNANVFKEKWNQVSYVGLRLNVPVFDGLQKVALVQQQRLNLTKNTNNLKNIQQTVNYQIQSTALSLANAARNVKVQQQNMLLAEEILQDTKTRYENSVAIYQEVIDAENVLKEAEVLYFTALYDYLVAEIDWKKANGKI